MSDNDVMLPRRLRYCAMRTMEVILGVISTIVLAILRLIWAVIETLLLSW